MKRVSFLLFNTWILVGFGLLSKDRSCRVKWVSGQKSDCDGAVNSLHLRTPKNAKQQAAHNMMLLWSRGLSFKVLLIFDITSRVIGSREHCGVSDLSFLIPFITISSFGVNADANWLCNPDETWRWRTADKYTLVWKAFLSQVRDKHKQCLFQGR